MLVPECNVAKKECLIWHKDFFFALPYIPSIFDSIFFSFSLLLFVEMAKVKLMQLLNTDCVLDILQGCLHLAIADDLVDRNRWINMQSFFRMFSYELVINLWSILWRKVGDSVSLPSNQTCSSFYVTCYSQDQVIVFSTELSAWNASSYSS